MVLNVWLDFLVWLNSIVQHKKFSGKTKGDISATKKGEMTNKEKRTI